MTVGIAGIEYVPIGWQRAREPLGADPAGRGGARSSGWRQRYCGLKMNRHRRPTAHFTTMRLGPSTVGGFDAD
jgi:hypothetical protein